MKRYRNINYSYYLPVDGQCDVDYPNRQEDARKYPATVTRWIKTLRAKRWSTKQQLWGVILMTVLFYCCTRSPTYQYHQQIQVEEETCFSSVADVVAHHLSWENNAIKHLVRQYLWPPSTLPYNLLDNDDDAIYSQAGIEDYILPFLFGNKTGGIFVEAGGADGEEGSNTLSLERFQGWTGLLVEPNTHFIPILYNKHRKAWIAPVCLAFYDYAHKATIEEIELVQQISTTGKKLNSTLRLCPIPNKENVSSWVGTYVDLEFAEKQGCREPVRKYKNVTCLPLHTILYSLNMTEIDYFSLDVEGVEMEILKTIPFNKVNIKVFQIEFSKMEDKGEEMKNFLERNGYKQLTHIKADMNKKRNVEVLLRSLLGEDYIFVKKELTLPIK